MIIDNTSRVKSSMAITVSALTFAIKNQLESRFHDILVQGEVSNAKLHSSGHLYFDLKDAQSKISAVMFRSSCQKLARPLKEGDQVTVKGSLSVYPPQGKYQMIVQSLEFQGIGELLLRLEELKRKLHGLGWFDADKKKPLPAFPKTIGVVTSPTGAVIRDIIHVLSRRFSGFHLILNPVRVQGAEAAQEIAQAIEDFNRYGLADVLIVARGGGSLEDLWAFNEEVVAKAIFESRIPIVSAVGHETDVTIADFVADIRAPTPSAAAEIVSAEKQHHLAILEKAKKTLISSLSHQLKQVRTELYRYQRHPLFASPFAILAGPIQKLDEIKGRLDEKMRSILLKKRYLLISRQKQAAALRPTAQLAHMRIQLGQIDKRLQDCFINQLRVKKQKLLKLVEHLQAVDPKKVLKRGYSILFAEKEGSVIVSAQAPIPGQKLRALLSDGEIKLTVDGDGTKKRRT